MYRMNYPRHGAEALDDAMRFRPATLRAVRAFARSKPYRGPQRRQIGKLALLHFALCRVYGRATRMTVIPREGRCSGDSCYVPGEDRIVLRGRFSVVTYLHEFAHALGRDERGACRWSLNLFKRCFPRSFARARFDGHMLVTAEADPPYPDRGGSHPGPGRK